ncbi:hypothetical protein BC833DRAFT_596884 [Globomyces pollinis-pini]|nr:hypothetical protein BC833DRAFT_596884 [Globomyces pollinis-pini]
MDDKQSSRVSLITQQIQNPNNTNLNNRNSTIINTLSTTNTNDCNPTDSIITPTLSNPPNPYQPYSIPTNASNILIGSHSKDSLLSIFLNGNHKVISVDAGNWPLLDGFIVSTHQSNWNGYCQVECSFKCKAVIGVLEKILYSEVIQLTQSEITIDGKRKFPFSFNFGSKALPPTFTFDPSDWHQGVKTGISWKVVGFMGQQIAPGPLSKDVLRIISPASTSFLVGYNYTEKTLDIYKELKLPQIVHSKRSLLPNPFTKSQDLSLTAKLSPPLMLQPNPHIVININVDHLLPTHRIEHVVVHFCQKLTFQLVSGQQFNFKKKETVYEQQPQDLFDESHPQQQSLEIVLEKEQLFNTPSSSFARVYPLDWDFEPSSNYKMGKYVPSTIYAELSHGSLGFEATYYFIVTLSIVDQATYKYKEIKTNIPFLVSGPSLLDDIPDIPHGVSNNPDIRILTRGTFLPILSSLLEDIGHSISGLENLLLEWRTFRYQANEREHMVTESSDHAIFLIEILDSYSFQLHHISKNLLNNTHTSRIHWPTSTIPFNMFLLELELLIRACPHAPEYSSLRETSTLDTSMQGSSDSHNRIPLSEPLVNRLIIESLTFMKTAHQLIMAWIQPANANVHDLSQHIEQMTFKVHDLLVDVVQGGDTDTGVNGKRDHELDEAIRLSLMDLESL